MVIPLCVEHTMIQSRKKCNSWNWEIEKWWM